MIQTKYNPKFSSHARINNYPQYQSFDPNRFRYSPNENKQKSLQFGTNTPQLSNVSNNCNSTAPSVNSSNIKVSNQQQSAYFQPLFYPSYDYFPYMNAINYNNYVNYCQYQQYPSQSQFSNFSNQYNINENQGLTRCQCSSPNKPIISYEEEEDSFGSVFYPFSLIHPTQFKRQKNDQSIILSEAQEKLNDFLPVQKEKKHISDLKHDTVLNENTNTPIIKHKLQSQKPQDKAINELDDNQKVFKPKSFKEIEEEERKYQNPSFKRNSKTW